MSTVSVNHIIDCSFVILFKYLYVQNVFANENLVGHADNLVFPVTIEYDDVVDIRTVAHKFILFQTRTNESFLAIDVEFLIGFNHFGSFDGIKVLDFGHPWVRLSIFIFDKLEPVDGDTYHLCKVAIDLVDLRLHLSNEFVSFVFTEL